MLSTARASVEMAVVRADSATYDVARRVIFAGGMPIAADELRRHFLSAWGSDTCYWNQLPDGSELDLTADQFRPGEQIVGGKVIARPPDAPRYHREQYELLRSRVLDALAADPES